MHAGRMDGGLVLLASYPKSGSTWLRAFLASAIADGAAIDINANLAGSVAGADRDVFDTSLRVNSRTMPPTAIARARHRAWTERARTSAEPIWLKVHDAWAEFAPNCPYPYPSNLVRAVIHVVRDPRDVAISFAHHFDLSIDDAIDWMADDAAMMDADPTAPTKQLPQLLSNWSAHVSSWKAAEKMRILTVRYEDMHQAPAQIFGRIARWTGLTTDQALVSRAVEQSRFSRLQSQEIRRGFVEGESQCERFFRNGTAGGWRDTLSARQSAAIVAKHGKIMQQLGYRA